MTEKTPAHARLSPSSAEAWFTCAGYPNAVEGLPNEDSEFSAEGTFAHRISDTCLDLDMDAHDFVGTKTTIKQWAFEWTDDDADYLQPGLDQIREFEGKFFGEHRVDLSNWLGPNQFGTLDRGVVGKNLTVLCDLKWGRGVPVSPVENKQLMLYSLGFWWNVARHLTDAKEFLILIDQPRCPGGGGEWRTTLDELLAFGEEAKKRAALTLDPNAPRTASAKGCHWCLRRKTPEGCDTYDEFNLSMLSAEFEDLDDSIEMGLPLVLPKRLTPERRTVVLQHKSMIEKWLEQLHAQALEDALRGDPVPGLKAVEGRKAPDKWRDKAAAEEVVLEILGDRGFTKKLKTPTQVAKEKISVEEFKTIEPLIETGSKKPILVPDADARPAITIADDFDDLD